MLSPVMNNDAQIFSQLEKKKCISVIRQIPIDLIFPFQYYKIIKRLVDKT